MALARIENLGPGPLLVQCKDGSWLDVPVGEVRVAEIVLVNNGKQRAHYRLGPADELHSYWLSPRMPVIYWGTVPAMWVSYVVLPVGADA